MKEYHAQQQCPPNTVPYVIRSGDTLTGLARKNGTTVASILAINPLITDPDYLRVGQRICIPRQPVYPACPGGNYYVIRRGDTFYAVARRFNIALEDLMEANPSVDPRMLAIGQVICVPVATVPARCPGGSVKYVIVPGDTLYTIALRRGVTVASLLKLNPGIHPDYLLVGQEICVPV